MVDIVNLKISKVLREIPGKRRVVDAIIDNENFIVKFFYNKGEYLKELNGALNLRNANIPTPKIFSFGKFLLYSSAYLSLSSKEKLAAVNLFPV